MTEVHKESYFDWESGQRNESESVVIQHRGKVQIEESKKANSGTFLFHGLIHIEGCPSCRG